MMIAVLSGKGGAGKTLAAVNLAAAAKQATYVDCDVEEPNGRLFLRPESIKEETVSVLLPEIDPEKCSGCRQCVSFCRFHAMVFIKGRPRVFGEACHSCGGCGLICPEKAISEKPRPIGHIEEGMREGIRVITGVLSPGEASGVPVIEGALRRAQKEKNGPIIIDCPPGSACPVQASLGPADFCLLVAEPTAFGFHNFLMVHELVRLMGKPCGVLINKMTEPYEPLEAYCKAQNLPILARLPYSPRLAAMAAKGEIISREDEAMAAFFAYLLQKIGGMAP